MKGTFELDPSLIRDIAPDVLDDDGRIRILPASYWATTTPEERALFGHRHATYSFPTVELVEHLRALIGDRKAIEIGAGNGVLAEALGIIATDNRQQEKRAMREYYERIKQPTISYGPNVVECEASEAVRKYKPQVVIGCWVTNKYDPNRPSAGGSPTGIKEEYIIDRCRDYVVIGNEEVHKGKSIWKLPHAIYHPDWLYSRAMNGTPNFIGIWT